MTSGAPRIPPCCGSSGVTIVGPGASWSVVFAGGLIHTACGKISRRGGPCTNRSGCASYAARARVMTDRKPGGGAPVVDVGGCEIGQPAVMMRIVVPCEELVAHAPGVFDRTEPGPETPADT